MKPLTLQPLYGALRFQGANRQQRLQAQMKIEREASDILARHSQGKPYSLRAQRACLLTNTLTVLYGGNNPNPQLEAQIRNDLKQMGQRFQEQQGEILYNDPNTHQQLKINLFCGSVGPDA